MNNPLLKIVVYLHKKYIDKHNGYVIKYKDGQYVAYDSAKKQWRKVKL